MNTLNIKQQALDFMGTEITAVVDEQDQLWLTGEQVGKCLNYTDGNKGISNLYGRHNDEFSGEDSTTLKLRAVDGKLRETRVYSATGCNKLGFFANTPRAKEFRTWASRVLAKQTAPNVEAADTAKLIELLVRVVSTQEKSLQLLTTLVERHTQPAPEMPARRAPQVFTDEEKDQLLHLLAKGYSQNAIARELGRSAGCVSKYVAMVRVAA